MILSSLRKHHVSPSLFAAGVSRTSSAAKSEGETDAFAGYVEIGCLLKFGSLRLNRDQVMILEARLKIHTNVCNFVTASPQTI